MSEEEAVAELDLYLGAFLYGVGYQEPCPAARNVNALAGTFETLIAENRNLDFARDRKATVPAEPGMLERFFARSLGDRFDGLPGLRLFQLGNILPRHWICASEGQFGVGGSNVRRLNSFGQAEPNVRGAPVTILTLQEVNGRERESSAKHLDHTGQVA